MNHKFKRCRRWPARSPRNMKFDDEHRCDLLENREKKTKEIVEAMVAEVSSDPYFKRVKLGF